MMWIMILLMSWTAPAITTVDGFATEQACLDFGKRFKEMDKSAFFVRYYCLQREK